MLAVVAGPALAAPPTNDDAATPHDLLLSLTGTRNAPTDAVTGVQAFGVDTSEATSSSGDPVLKNDNETSSCNSLPTQGNDTVFYRLRFLDGGPLFERTAITIDTTGSTYPTAIAVYRGSISQATLIRCERPNLANGAATVDLVTEQNDPGTLDYFVEVASVGGSGLLNLFVRATDVQPPTLVLSAPSGAEPNKLTRFTLQERTDRGIGLVPDGPVVWSVTFTPVASAGTTPTPVEPPYTVDPDGDGAEITVRWPRNGNGFGRAVARVSDAAGNVGRSTLQVRVMDRTPPQVTLSTSRGNAARRQIAATIRCNESGKASITLRTTTAKPRTSQISAIRAGVRRRVVFRHVRTPTVFFLDYVCYDGANNASRSRTLPGLIGY
jgi:hypothetical protein